MTNIRDKRMADLRAKLARLREHREAAIHRLVKLDTQVNAARLKLARLERAAAKPKPVTVHGNEPKPEALNVPRVEDVKPLPPELVEEYRHMDDDLEVPGFLRRNPEGDAKDAAARAEIEAEQAERKRNKSRGRIAKMKAAQAGDTTKMPLTGKAALAAIRS